MITVANSQPIYREPWYSLYLKQVVDGGEPLRPASEQTEAQADRENKVKESHKLALAEAKAHVDAAVKCIGLASECNSKACEYFSKALGAMARLVE